MPASTLPRHVVATRAQYDQETAAMRTLTDRAANENRGLTTEEFATFTAHRTSAENLASQLQAFSEDITRSRDVDALDASLRGEQGAEGETGERNAAETGNGERLSGNAQVRHRDPGHYRAVREGGRNSWFADRFRAEVLNDKASRDRLTEHNRALDLPNEGVGLLPPKWLTDEYAPFARQGRRAANAVRHIDLGSDPRPMSMPKQTAGTDNVVADQANENDAVPQTDAFDTDVDTVTPRVTSGAQNFSRQMFDMSDPAIDQLIYTDLLEVFDAKVEGKVIAAMITSAGTATKTYATEAAYTAGLDPTDATFIGDYVIDTALAVRMARKLPANVLISSVQRYGSLLKIKDSTGRPLVPPDSAGPVNIIGQGQVDTDGRFEGLPIIASDGITQYPESILVARAQDVLLFESAVMRFRYEEVTGPETIRVGVWGYTATYVKYSGKSVKRIAITAAA